MAGLGAVERLHGAGKRVVLVEAAPTVGGLARAITVGREPIEPITVEPIAVRLRAIPY